MKKLIKEKWGFILVLIFSLLGLYASFTLSYDSYLISLKPETTLPCNLNSTFNCTSVMNSDYSHLFGFPNPWIGMIGYTAMSIFALYGILGMSKKIVYDIFTLGSLVSTIFSWYLMYISKTVLEIYCIYCILSCICSTVILIVNVKNRKSN
jgi:uncharacterized membrane protein